MLHERYCTLLSALFSHVFPSPQDYDSRDEELFRRDVAQALVLAITKVHTQKGVAGDGELGEYRHDIFLAIINGTPSMQERINSLEEEVATLKANLADRKDIERAKGIVMQAGLSEPEAHKRLQSLAAQKNMRVGVLARMVTDLADLFEAR